MVSEKEQIEKNLLMRHIIDFVPHFILVLDSNNVIVLASQSVSNLIGLQSKDLEGKMIDNFINQNILFKSLFDFNPQTDGESVYIPKITNYRDKNGSIKWMQIVKYPINLNESIFTIIGAMDVTNVFDKEISLKKSEEKYRNFYKNTPVMMHSIDSEGRIISVSNYWLTSLGYNIEEVLGYHITDFLDTKTSKSAIKKGLPDFFRTGACLNIPCTFIKKNGEKIDTLLSSTSDRDADGNVIRSLTVAIDVTERNAAIKALRESEHSYKTLFSKMTIGFVLLEIQYDMYGKVNDLIYKEINPALLLLLNVDKEIIEGKSLTQINLGGSKFWIDLAQEITENNTNHKFEYYSEKFNKDLEVIAFPFRKDQLAVLLTDITSRKNSEKILQDSSEKFKKLVENTSDVIWLLDTDFSPLYVSPSITNVSGYTVEEEMNMKLEDRFPPSSLEKIYKENIIFINKLKNNDIQESYHIVLQVEYKLKNGNLTWVELTISPVFDEKMNLIAFQGVTRNIDERRKAENALKESEKKYKLIVENTSDVIWIMDKDLKTTYISPSIEKFTGYSPEEYKLLSFSEKYSQGSIDLINMKFDEISSLMNHSSYDENFSMTFDVEFIKKVGAVVIGEITATAIFDPQNDLIGYHGITRDVTERKLNEQIVLDSEKRLRELNKSKDKFFSIIAHDLKNPLGTFKDMTKILHENFDSIDEENKKNLVAGMNQSAAHLIDLLENLLQWTRSQTGNIPFAPEMIDLHFVVSNSIDIMKMNADVKHIRIVSNVSELTFVFADLNMISTVIRNLISNAIKFTFENGEIEIKFKKTRGSNGEKLIEISVSDNGIGIEDNIIQKLFKIESQYTSLGTSKEKGTGLGLILCNEFIEKHNGTIHVVSEPKKGTTFIISLPDLYD
jgi:PAS domain S-box-containing protein